LARKGVRTQLGMKELASEDTETCKKHVRISKRKAEMND
jgi:hypothetical protein